MKPVKKTNATTCTTIANTSTVISDATAQSTAPADLLPRIKALTDTATPLRQAFADALNAIKANEANTLTKSAEMAAITVKVTTLFVADMEAARTIFVETGIKSRFGIDEYPDYYVAKWLTGKTGGSATKMACVSAGLRRNGVSTYEEALDRIRLGKGFAEVYKHFRPKRANDNDAADLTGATVVIHLSDGSSGIVPLTARQIIALAAKKGVVWKEVANKNIREASEPTLTLPSPSSGQPDEAETAGMTVGEENANG